jgi:hypothetical protein
VLEANPDHPSRNRSAGGVASAGQLEGVTFVSLQVARRRRRLKFAGCWPEQLENPLGTRRTGFLMLGLT